ncbi:hypothetical protein AM1_6259 [Acaryochloris marina MBIC11017]|uniref:Uncharacterized protein n=1 Tax=Acaryochloris marina (strain MBIC 11017) TaxID=329726 RepID=B0C674_ACAM1|nr:hypothetical protein AM1_6259 [Acaryochloris marina MBIC11017]
MVRPSKELWLVRTIISISSFQATSFLEANLGSLGISV